MFDQIRQHVRGESVFQPTPADRLRYVEELYECVTLPNTSELDMVNRIKKHLNFFAWGLADAEGFLSAMRRCTTRAGIMEVCTRHFGE
jgi:hypothetical protein